MLGSLRVERATTLDQGLTRAARRAALKQLWAVNGSPQIITVSGHPVFCAADGEYVWIACYGTVDQVQASTGKVIGTWTGATLSWPIAAIPGLILTADNTSGALYIIDPVNAPGSVSSALSFPAGTSSLAYDGVRVWAANFSGTVSTLFGGTVSNHSDPGFMQPVGLIYDGTHMWVVDNGADALFELNSDGSILNTVAVGSGPQRPAFDGANIWVPNYFDNTISVVSVSAAKVIATIASDPANQLSGPQQVSFDGERMLVTNNLGDGTTGSVTIFKAADYSVLGNIASPTGLLPYGACSDGVNFWVAFSQTHSLLKY